MAQPFSPAQVSPLATDKPLIVVCGATGLLGGAVVDALIESKKFRIRGVCKIEDFGASRELQCEGCEMIECDLVQTENLLPIFKDAFGAFIVTDSLDSSMHLHEKEIGIRLINAAKGAGVKHLVFVSLPDVDGISQGRFKVPAFSQKAEVERAINLMQSVSIMRPFATTTILRPGFYYQNFRKFFAPRSEGDKLIFTMPSTGHPISSFNANDIGPIVRRIFEEPYIYDRQRVDIATEQLTETQFLAAIKKASGKEVDLVSIPRGQYSKEVHASWSEEMAQLFGFIDEYGFFGPDADFSLCKILNPNLTSFEEFLQTSEWAHAVSSDATPAKP